MAGRGGVKLKEYRTAVTSLKQWQSELQFPHLSIVEVFSSSFGSCQVILPTINSIMTNTPDSDQRIRWLTLNVGKLEEEQKAKEDEEQKKNEDIHGKQKTPTRIVQPAPAPTSDVHVIEPQMEQKEQDPAAAGDADSDDPTASPPAAAAPAAAAPPAKSTPTIPLLEAYHSYDHPRPLWLFFLNGQLLYELTSANPPKMLKLVQSCLSGSQLSADELAGMELQTDTPEVAAEKKRRRLQKKKEEEEAKRKAKEAEEAQQAKKKREIVRTTPEYLLHLSLSAYTNQTSDAFDPTPPTDRLPVLVLSWKDGDSDFYYLAQTPRTEVGEGGAVIFPLAVVWKKPEGGAEAEAKVDLRLALYEAADDEPIKGEREGAALLGEGYVNLAALLAGETEVRLIHHDPAPPLSPTAKSPRPAARVERVMAVASVRVRDRVSEGALTDYRAYVNVAGFAPASAPVDGAAPTTGYTVTLSALDDTTPVWVVQGVTESMATIPLAFVTPLPFTAYSNLPRQLRLQLSAEGGGAAINTAIIPLTLALRPSLRLPTVDAAGNPSPVHFALRVEEVDEDGTARPAGVEVTAEERQRQAALDWVEVTFTALNLPSPPPTQPVLVVYRQEDGGAVTQLGSTKAPGAAAADSGAYAFPRPFLLPLDPLAPYKVVVLASADEAAALVGQKVIEGAGWGEGGGEVEVALETVEGVAVGEAVVRGVVRRLGRAEALELEVSAAGLPAGGEGGEERGWVVAVWREVGGVWGEMVGMTERAVGPAPTFTTVVPVRGFTGADTPLVLNLHGVGSEVVVDDSTLLASVPVSAAALRYTSPTPSSFPLRGVADATLTVVNRLAVEPPAEEAPMVEAPTVEAVPAVVEGAQPEVAPEAQPAELEVMALTFNVTGVEGAGEGWATLRVRATGAGAAEAVDVGAVEAELSGGAAAFAVPISLVGYLGGARQVTGYVERDGQVVGEVVLPLAALSTQSEPSSHPLTRDGQTLQATLTVRVNAHFDDAAPTPTPPPVPTLPTEALTASTPPQPPATKSQVNSARPPMTSRSSKPSAQPTPRSKSPSKAPSKVPSRAPSVHATPRSAREGSAKGKGSPVVSQTRQVTGGAGEHGRAGSRSVSAKESVSRKSNSLKVDDTNPLDEPSSAAVSTAQVTQGDVGDAAQPGVEVGGVEEGGPSAIPVPAEVKVDEETAAVEAVVETATIQAEGAEAGEEEEYHDDTEPAAAAAAAEVEAVAQEPVVEAAAVEATPAVVEVEAAAAAEAAPAEEVKAEEAKAEAVVAVDDDYADDTEAEAAAEAAQ